MARRRPASVREAGLLALRRSGSVSEILFLFECATQEVLTLRPVAERLGLTVQAISHLYRQLSSRGLVEVRGGRYRPTVAGYARLHGVLATLDEEIARRLDHLQVVRTAQAVAVAPIEEGQTVSLELQEGYLVARPKSQGASRGTARGSARTDELVEVGGLEGIVPIAPGAIVVYVIPRGASENRAVRSRVQSIILSKPGGILASQGLEAFHLLRTKGAPHILRFGVAGACLEAARLGVGSIVFVTEEELPRFLAAFASPDAPSVEIRPLGRRSSRRGLRRR